MPKCVTYVSGPMCYPCSRSAASRCLTSGCNKPSRRIKGILMVRSLLWVDCSAGILAGAVVLSFSGWLSQLYALPVSLLVAMGIANVAYGTFSLSLALRTFRPRAQIEFLALANASWAALCGFTAVVVAERASRWGLAHLIVECALVGGLAGLEWRHRERLVLSS